MTIEVYFGRTIDGQNFVNTDRELPIKVEPKSRSFTFHLESASLDLNWGGFSYEERKVKIKPDKTNNGGLIEISGVREDKPEAEEIVLADGGEISRVWADRNVGFRAVHKK